MLPLLTVRHDDDIRNLLKSATLLPLEYVVRVRIMIVTRSERTQPTPTTRFPSPAERTSDIHRYTLVAGDAAARYKGSRAVTDGRRRGEGGTVSSAYVSTSEHMRSGIDSGTETSFYVLAGVKEAE